MAVKSEIGSTFGWLTVLSRSGSKNGKAEWSCRCKCGSVVVVSGGSLRQGKTKSCGCYRRYFSAVKSYKHGQSNGGGAREASRTYKTWQEMRKRCEDPTNISYRNYGAKGVTVCDEWQEFTRFFADMGERPSGTSIDRIDLTLGYFPENCQWSTRKVQNRNRSNVRLITWRGSAKCLAEWCEDFGAPYHKTYYLVFSRGLSLEEAFLKLSVL